MTPVLLPFLLFAIVASMTPGPNNIMIMGTAAAGGMRAALPLMFGVGVGFAFRVLVVGLGLAVPVARFPAVQAGLRWVGAAWMLLLAWRIATAPPIAAGGGRPARMGFWGACAFQWVNPKAWVMALATAATYTVAGIPPVRQVPVLAGLFAVTSVLSTGSWALLGLGARQLLTSERRQRGFNRAMGLALAVSVLPVILE